MVDKTIFKLFFYNIVFLFDYFLKFIIFKDLNINVTFLICIISNKIVSFSNSDKKQTKLKIDTLH